MKKVLVILLVVIVLGVGGFFVYKTFFAEDKNAWKVEINLYEINVRKSPTTSSVKVGGVKKGEIYKVYEMDEDDMYFWYKIEFKKGQKGWIASDKYEFYTFNPGDTEIPFEYLYVKDINNPNDILPPVLKYFDEAYTVDKVSNINFKHLEVCDFTHRIDKENIVEYVNQVKDCDVSSAITDTLTLSYDIWVEEWNSNTEYNLNKVWIRYNATDVAGNTTSKIQPLIVTDQIPDAVGDWNTTNWIDKEA